MNKSNKTLSRKEIKSLIKKRSERGLVKVKKEYFGENNNYYYYCLAGLSIILFFIGYSFPLIFVRTKNKCTNKAISGLILIFFWPFILIGTVITKIVFNKHLFLKK